MQETISTQEEQEFLTNLTNPHITHIREKVQKEFIKLYNDGPHHDLETWRKIENAIGNIWGFNIAREIKSKANLINE